MVLKRRAVIDSKVVESGQFSMPPVAVSSELFKNLTKVILKTYERKMQRGL